MAVPLIAACLVREMMRRAFTVLGPTAVGMVALRHLPKQGG